ncbi:MAG: hypothetical protein ACLTYN_08260 [Dysosmobacter welbionis]
MDLCVPAGHLAAVSPAKRGRGLGILAGGVSPPSPAFWRGSSGRPFLNQWRGDAHAEKLKELALRYEDLQAQLADLSLRRRGAAEDCKSGAEDLTRVAEA